MKSRISWVNCDYLKLWQLVYLLHGEPPPDEEDLSFENTPHTFAAAKTVLWNAFDNKEIEGTIGPEVALDSKGNPIFYDVVERQNLTMLNVSSVLSYLDRKRIDRGLLKSPTEPDYLNSASIFYARKMAAAIAAWKAISSDEKLRTGKSVKQALTKWLEEHAVEYDLTPKGIEEAATVANWGTSGGAPSTPSQKT